MTPVVEPGGGLDGVDAVVKVGGGPLRARDSLGPDALDRGTLDVVAAAITDAARRRRLVIVPGGGPFADAVRTADAALSLDATTAHWMAVLGMDQMAHLLAARIAGSELAESERAVRSALGAGSIPVLAPYRWLRAADPLPHSWSVTSDSIAAWLAGALGAERLVLVKPVAGELTQLADEHFSRALPPTVRACAVAATTDRSTFTRALDAALRGAGLPPASDTAR